MEHICEISSTMSYLLEETNRTTENIETGLTELDNITSGCRKSELIVIGSEVKMGNTPFLITLLRNIVYEKNISAAYFSLKQSKYLVTSYLLSNICDVEIKYLRDGKLNPSQKMDIEKALTKIDNSPLYIDDRSDLSVSDIKNSLYELRTEDHVNIDVIFVDGLNLMNYRGELCMHSDKALGLTILGLKELAKLFQIPVFVTYQMDSITRSGSEKRPFLCDLTEKNKLFSAADMMWFIYRPEYYHITEDEDGNSMLGKAEIIAAGQGANGIATVSFRRQYSKFEDRYSGFTF
jgi:replicative DNA helicase